MPSVALITGGAVRVGRAITLGLVDAGYDVVVNYHSSENPARELAALAEARGRKALIVQGDVSDPGDVARIGEAVRSQCDRLELLVNSASSFHATSLLDIDSDEWDRVMEVNLKGPHLVVRECADLLRAACGAVVNIADHMGLEPWVHYAHHSVSKAALIHLTRIQAKALAPHVRVNAIVPGLVLAPEALSEEELAAEIAATALHATGSPEDVVRTVLFLASSPYITGQMIVVDGGRSLGR
ncbi:MAG: 3-oxoacyl-[acyl-carrier-protein] reductase [Gemmatimonadota bacterium]|nr:MAG: 3-oxoacyl-[acyl-carrier-protein] reductase [Gemmatimonadota bacterium]